MDYARTLRACRKAAAMSQDELAAELRHVQINQSRLSDMEHGRAVPDRAQEAAIATALGMDADARAAWSAEILEAEARRRAGLSPTAGDTDALPPEKGAAESV